MSAENYTNLIVGDRKFVFEWPKSGLAKIKDVVNFLESKDVGKVVAVWEKKKRGRRRRRASSILDDPELYCGMYMSVRMSVGMHVVCMG